jgi:hypothetical protein
LAASCFLFLWTWRYLPEEPSIPIGPCDIETQLEEERKQRREAEEALDDVRRECTHPFIVPQIMDAFIKVSKLTTKAIHGD